jgi:MYXO-CTERM domain-containing protein
MLRAGPALLALCAASFFQLSFAVAQERCFERLDNGVDMTGWKRSSTNHHGPGNGWTVEGGAFVGRQTAGNQGGILMTDKTFKDVEVIFQVKIDWGCDSGFFFRTTAGDRGYQVNLDHLQDSGVGTIYGEGFAQELRYRPYFLSNMGMTANKDPDLVPFFDLSKWSTIWKPTDFNEIRARVEGNPPHMQVWISGLQVIDFTDAMTRAEIDATGPLAIQVHGGAERWLANGSVQFKNIRAKDLSVPCENGGAGGGGAGGGGGVGGAAGGAGGGGAGGVTPVGGGGAATGGGGTAPATSGASGSAGAPPNMTPSGGVAGSNASPTAPSAGPNDAGGCGCRVGPARARLAGVGLLLLLGLLLRRRR